MKANELRIGNYIMFGVMRHQIKPYDILNLHKMELAGGNSDPYSAILLTEEWLLKFGFRKSAMYFDIGKFVLVKYTDDQFHCTINAHDLIILHVHQLQNLYFALTGEELQITDYLQ